MNKGFLFFPLMFLMLMQQAYAQQQKDIVGYIEKYKAIALEEMVRCGIPASITIAQGIHESSCGKSPLSREANNHFGIKCKDEWNGKKYYQNDDAPNECFRVYEHAEESYTDHSDFLVTRPRYADLFKLPITDYKGWANGLKSCGYATNPKYAQILIGKIEEYHLYDLDRQGLAMKDEKDKLFAYTGPQDAPIAATPVAKTPAPIAANKETKPVEAEAKHTIFEKPKHEGSRKQYMVNGSLAIIAQGNEEPLKVAFDNNIDFSYVLMFNDLTPGEHFKEGEYIFLQSKKSKGAQPTYVVQPGESMRDISQKTGVKLRELYYKNMMRPNEQAYAGEAVNLQERRAEPPHIMSYADFLKTQPKNTSAVTETAKNTTASITKNRSAQLTQYQVQATDTLFSIARKFNTTIEELKSLNNLDGTNLQPGQRLVVSK